MPGFLWPLIASSSRRQGSRNHIVLLNSCAETCRLHTKRCQKQQVPGGIFGEEEGTLLLLHPQVPGQIRKSRMSPSKFSSSAKEGLVGGQGADVFGFCGLNRFHWHPGRNRPSQTPLQAIPCTMLVSPTTGLYEYVLAWYLSGCGRAPQRLARSDKLMS